MDNSVCYMFSKDTDEIDDLFQEILIRLWKGYDSFRAESDVRTWIYRVALQTKRLINACDYIIYRPLYRQSRLRPGSGKRSPIRVLRLEL